MPLQELPGLDKHAQQVFGELSRMPLSLQTCDVRFLLFDPVLSVHDLLEGRFQIGLSVVHSRLIANGCGQDLATNQAQRCDCLRLLEADHTRECIQWLNRLPQLRDSLVELFERFAFFCYARRSASRPRGPWRRSLERAALLANIEGMLASLEMLRTVNRAAAMVAVVAISGLWVARRCCPRSGHRGRAPKP
jgi:hypothetical protein